MSERSIEAQRSVRLRSFHDTLRAKLSSQRITVPLQHQRTALPLLQRPWYPNRCWGYQSATGDQCGEPDDFESDLGNWHNLSADTDREIRLLSDGLRRAVQCPVCLELPGTVPACCENGHGTCNNCAGTLFQMERQYSQPGCPLCRSPIFRPLHWDNNPGYQHRWTAQQPPTARKVYDLMSVTRVTCSFRTEGCPDLVFLSKVAEHEALCPHVPKVRCMAPCCGWLGAYEQLFEHVASEHQFCAYDVLDNWLIMPDLTFGLKDNVRRMYLVRNLQQHNQLYWVGLRKPIESVVQVTVLKVVHPANASQTAFQQTNMEFRVETINEEHQYQIRGPPRPVCWDRVALTRSIRALEHDKDLLSVMSMLQSPPWCITSVYNNQRHKAKISWYPLLRVNPSANR